MQIIPLVATPSQTVNATLSNQQCQINIYEKEPGIALYGGASFTGAISGAVLTVSYVNTGPLVIGHLLALFSGAPGIIEGTAITGQLTGTTGGVGQYIISNYHYQPVAAQIFVAPELFNPQALYCDLYVNNALIIAGVLCLNEKVIVRNVYLGFIGDLAFVDTQGDNDPDYTGLVDRYAFVYYLPSELPVGLQ